MNKYNIFIYIYQSFFTVRTCFYLYFSFLFHLCFSIRIDNDYKKDCTLCNRRARAECEALFSSPRGAHFLCEAHLYVRKDLFSVLLYHFTTTRSFLIYKKEYEFTRILRLRRHFPFRRSAILTKYFLYLFFIFVHHQKLHLSFKLLPSPLFYLNISCNIKSSVFQHHLLLKSIANTLLLYSLFAVTFLFLLFLTQTTFYIFTHKKSSASQQNFLSSLWEYTLKTEYFL